AQIPGAFYSGPTPRGWIVPPGAYQVKLSVGGKTIVQPLTVKADPRDPPGAEAAIDAKTQLAIAVYHDIDAVHRAVNDIRKTRAELTRVKTGAKASKELVSTADSLDGRLKPIEETLMQVNMKGSEANLAFPGMLNEQYASFQGAIDDADTPPTAPELAMYDDLHRRLEVQLAAWRAASGT
ncbi:MAG: hypothetical protein KGL69_08825, partial [Alphaproteobacteria bacterium]|nr:hypothetical protein [Alphaproteobacteria bacterium]